MSTQPLLDESYSLTEENAYTLSRFMDRHLNEFIVEFPELFVRLLDARAGGISLDDLVEEIRTAHSSFPAKDIEMFIDSMSTIDPRASLALRVLAYPGFRARGKRVVGLHALFNAVTSRTERRYLLAGLRNYSMSCWDAIAMLLTAFCLATVAAGLYVSFSDDTRANRDISLVLVCVGLFLLGSSWLFFIPRRMIVREYDAAKEALRDRRGALLGPNAGRIEA